MNDISKRVREGLHRVGLPHKLRPGQRVAITAGSRGISRIEEVLQAVTNTVQELGGNPVILAAMGSHGGGTEAGQIAVLASLGITGATMGCPIVASETCVCLGKTAQGLPLYVLEPAARAEALIVLNRIKPHTAFRGPIESGLVKMMAVGLGGPKGAQTVHSQGVQNMAWTVQSVGQELLRRLPVLAGIGLLENPLGLEEIMVTNSEGFLGVDKLLLVRAWNEFPGLPFQHIHVLIVEEMGKCYSGTGLDPNVIGRLRIHGVPEPEQPGIDRLVVLRLAAASHGNANGIGLADITTLDLVRHIDFQATYLNVLTSGYVQRAMLPVIMSTEQEAIREAVESLGGVHRQSLKLVRVKNTLHLDEIEISQALLKEVPERGWEVAGEPGLLNFDSEGRLI